MWKATRKSRVWWIGVQKRRSRVRKTAAADPILACFPPFLSYLFCRETDVNSGTRQDAHAKARSGKASLYGISRNYLHHLTSLAVFPYHRSQARPYSESLLLRLHASLGMPCFSCALLIDRKLGPRSRFLQFLLQCSSDKRRRRSSALRLHKSRCLVT